MNTKKKLEMTQKGLEDLRKELKDRKTKIKKKLQDELDEEMGYGDLSENANYYRIQDEIASNDKRISELEDMIKNSFVVEEKECSTDNCSVGIGSTIKVKKDEKEITYELVGATEADPTKNKISIESPMGQAFVDKKVGETATVTTPIGLAKYDIIDIS
ncbi:GreA/GreB family elongation factor [Candidatus Dojkabacteria bacterium]|nr:GreA/GreB family elongation factor [Candidatus Dojkabacteria bacterium]